MTLAQSICVDLVDFPVQSGAAHPGRDHLRRDPRPGRTAAFPAMAVGGDPYRRALAVRRLKALGAGEVTEAGTVLQARAWARTAGPRDVCIAEAVLPDGSGIALLADLTRSGWGGCVLVSGPDVPRAVHAALTAGVRACVVGGARAPHGARSESREAAALLGLSEREVEVLGHVAAGRSNAVIGESMGVSGLTVKSHLARIGRKLGTGDRAGLVAKAFRARVLT